MQQAGYKAAAQLQQPEPLLASMIRLDRVDLLSMLVEEALDTEPFSYDQDHLQVTTERLMDLCFHSTLEIFASNNLAWLDRKFRTYDATAIVRKILETDKYRFYAIQPVSDALISVLQNPAHIAHVDSMMSQIMNYGCEHQKILIDSLEWYKSAGHEVTKQLAIDAMNNAIFHVNKKIFNQEHQENDYYYQDFLEWKKLIYFCFDQSMTPAHVKKSSGVLQFSIQKVISEDWVGKCYRNYIAERASEIVEIVWPVQNRMARI